MERRPTPPPILDVSGGAGLRLRTEPQRATLEGYKAPAMRPGTPKRCKRHSCSPAKGCPNRAACQGAKDQRYAKAPKMGGLQTFAALACVKVIIRGNGHTGRELGIPNQRTQLQLRINLCSLGLSCSAPKRQNSVQQLTLGGYHVTEFATSAQKMTVARIVDLLSQEQARRRDSTRNVPPL